MRQSPKYLILERILDSGIPLLSPKGYLWYSEVTTLIDPRCSASRGTGSMIRKYKSENPDWDDEQIRRKPR